MPGPDWDKEEFLRYCEALTIVRDDGSKTYCTTVPYATVFFLESWLYNFGGAVMNDEFTESRLATSGSKEAFRFAHDMLYKYQIAPVPQPGDGGNLSRFVSKQIAMMYAGRWLVKPLVEQNINFDLQYYPTFRQNQVIYGVDTYAVSRTSKYPE